MNQYSAFVLSEEEFQKITGEKPKFTDFGFVSNQNDWWNDLEKYLQKPIISVRPSGRPGWTQVIVLTAEGTVGEKIALKGHLEYIMCALHDIFAEMENDELEVLEYYEFPDLTDTERQDLKEWIDDLYGDDDEIDD